jgi:hypothetical protein
MQVNVMSVDAGQSWGQHRFRMVRNLLHIDFSRRCKAMH